MARVMKLVVRLNGTSENPWTPYGLTQNPFPQVAEYGFVAGCLAVQSLEGEPIPHDRAEAYIRERLKGFSDEFVDGVVKRFVPGQMVEFEVAFPVEG
jgi:hypothetical protein